MARLIALLLIALLFEAVGVVVLKRGLQEIGELQGITFREVVRVAKSGAANRHILLGVFMETVFFVLLLVMLKGWDVSLVWPLTSLGFVFTTVAAKFINHEQVNALRWSGVFLIMAGAALVGYSEKFKAPPPSASKVAAGADLSKE